LILGLRFKNSARASAANGVGDRRPISQFCIESRVTGKPAALKTFVAWAWLKLLAVRHFLRCSITAANSLGISTPSSQMASLNASFEEKLSSRLTIVKASDPFQPLAKRKLCTAPVHFIKQIDALTRGLRCQTMLGELSDHSVRLQVENRSAITFDLQIGLVDNVEHRMSEEARGEHVPGLAWRTLVPLVSSIATLTVESCVSQIIAGTPAPVLS